MENEWKLLYVTPASWQFTLTLWDITNVVMETVQCVKQQSQSQSIGVTSNRTQDMKMIAHLNQELATATIKWIAIDIILILVRIIGLPLSCIHEKNIKWVASGRSHLDGFSIVIHWDSGSAKDTTLLNPPALERDWKWSVWGLLLYANLKSSWWYRTKIAHKKLEHETNLQHHGYTHYQSLINRIIDFRLSQE